MFVAWNVRLPEVACSMVPFLCLAISSVCHIFCGEAPPYVFFYFCVLFLVYTRSYFEVFRFLSFQTYLVVFLLCLLCGCFTVNRCLHPPVDTQHSQCPSRFFGLTWYRDTNTVGVLQYGFLGKAVSRYMAVKIPWLDSTPKRA